MPIADHTLRFENFTPNSESKGERPHLAGTSRLLAGALEIHARSMMVTRPSATEIPLAEIAH